MTKLDSVIIFIMMMASQLYAQIGRMDTVVLSVYNTGQRFMLYPMPFGKAKPDSMFTVPMVAALDTVNVQAMQPDSVGLPVPVWRTARQCGKIAADVRGKIALMERLEGCDVSAPVLAAQRAGALVAVVIHSTNNRDSVRLPLSLQYVDSQRVTIPCYTVRQSIGEKIGMMLPSMVGIKILAHDDSSRNDIQNRVTMSNPNAAVTQLTVAKTDVPNANDAADKTVEMVDIGWRLAPNPTTDEITIHYQFAEKTATSLEIFNETGQLVTN